MPLTFTKFRFLPLKKKKTTKPPPKFYNSSSFGPQGKKIKEITRGTSLRVPHQRRLSQNSPWGPKLPHVQNLGDDFVVFLRSQNRNFEKVMGLKLLLSLILIEDLFLILNLNFSVFYNL